MSTVGVDIGDWIYEKKVRSSSSHGPVIFRTWDFGGQKEYVGIIWIQFHTIKILIVDITQPISISFRNGAST